MMIDSNAPLVPPAEVRETAGGVSGQGRFIGPLSMIIRAQLLARVSRIRLALPLAKPSTQNLSELAALVDRQSALLVLLDSGDRVGVVHRPLLQVQRLRPSPVLADLEAGA
jgi:hypothetical protein